MVIYLPNTTHNIPHESPVVVFVLVSPTPLVVVPKGRIGITIYGESLLPVVLTVFLSALLEMLGSIEDHSLDLTTESQMSEAEKRSIETLRIPFFGKGCDSLNDVIAGTNVQESCYDLQWHEVASPLPFLHITNSTGVEGAAVAGVLNHRLALQIIMREAINIVASSTKMVVRTPPQNGLIYILSPPLKIAVIPGTDQPDRLG